MAVPVWVWFNSAMFAGGAWFLWWRVVAQTTERGTTVRRLGTAFFALVGVAAVLALIGQYAMPMAFQRFVGWPAWTAYAFVIFAGCTALLLEPVRIGAWFVRRRRRKVFAVAPAGEIDPTAATAEPVDAEPADPDPAGPSGDAAVPRRLALQRVAAFGILGTGAALTGISLAGALGTPRVRRQQIAIRSLPDEAVGTRIALISDLHVGPLTTRADCQRVVDLVNAQNPDIVCLAGDFSDGDAATLAADLTPLAGLRSTAGTFFVTGNHEFYFDVDSWLAYFPTIGVRVLANESVQLRGLLLAGTHDIQGESQGRGPDVALALQGRADGQPALLLSHNPAVLDDAIANDVDLVLAGHTHGGQFYPGVWIVGATTRTLSGHYTFGGTQVFVTNGCRFWGPPARLGAPMDITVLDLVRA